MPAPQPSRARPPRTLTPVPRKPNVRPAVAVAVTSSNGSKGEHEGVLYHGDVRKPSQASLDATAKMILTVVQHEQPVDVARVLDDHSSFLRLCHTKYELKDISPSPLAVQEALAQLVASGRLVRANDQLTLPRPGQQQQTATRRPSGNVLDDGTIHSTPSQQHLYTIEEMPRWLTFNRFIRTGYRRAPGLPLRDALSSLFGVHNESFNMWSHLVPAVVLWYWLLRDAWQWCFVEFGGSYYNSGSDWDSFSSSSSSSSSAAAWSVASLHHHDSFLRLKSVIFYPGLASFAFVFTASVAYHWFMPCCRRHRQYEQLICWDVIGSLLAITSTGLSFLLYGYRCFGLSSAAGGGRGWERSFDRIGDPEQEDDGRVRMTYNDAHDGRSVESVFASNMSHSLLLQFMLLCFLASGGMVAWVVVRAKMSAAGRTKLFGLHCFFRLSLFVVVSWPKIVHHGFEHSFWCHVGSCLCLLLGGWINAKRWPEAIFPDVRWLDFVLNSHNLWHLLCIVVASLAMLGCYYDEVEFSHTIC